MKWFLRILLGTGFAVALIVWAIRPGSENSLHWIPVEKREPIDLSGSFKTLNGQTVSLNDYRDKVLFLNVWATWCAPCRAEMPDMANLHQELSGEGLSIVAVTDEDPETVNRFLAENSYPFTVLLDPENILSERFSIEGIPTTFVVDSEGRLALQQTGGFSWGSTSSIRSFRQLLGK